jgi:hypothetical protein
VDETALYYVVEREHYLLSILYCVDVVEKSGPDGRRWVKSHFDIRILYVSTGHVAEVTGRMECSILHSMNEHPNHVNHAQFMLSGIPFLGVFRSAII